MYGCCLVRMSKQVRQSIQDVLPTATELPSKLVSFTESLYSMSVQKQPLPPRAEIARYHICAYLAAEKYHDQLQLPEPSTTKIPLQPKVVFKILDDFRVNLLNGVRSPSTTPKKTRTPQSSPSKTQLSPTKHQPRISSPLKRLQELQDEEPAPKRAKSPLKDAESPFNPKVPSTPKKSPTKSSPSKTRTPASTPRYQRQLTIADFISFANNFYIPASITAQMVVTYLEQRHKFTKKSEWLLACGMVHLAYCRINHRLLLSTMGAKSDLQDQLFQYQKGGLMKWNVVLWLNIIENSIKNEPWILELEKKYVDGTWTLDLDPRPREVIAKLGKGWDLPERLGSMVNASTMFESPSQNKYHETWTRRALGLLNS